MPADAVALIGSDSPLELVVSVWNGSGGTGCEVILLLGRPTAGHEHSGLLTPSVVMG